MDDVRLDGRSLLWEEVGRRDARVHQHGLVGDDRSGQTYNKAEEHTQVHSNIHSEKLPWLGYN